MALFWCAVRRTLPCTTSLWRANSKNSTLPTAPSILTVRLLSTTSSRWQDHRLSQSQLEALRREAFSGRGPSSGPSLGPFPTPRVDAHDSLTNNEMRSWSELRGGEKVARAGRQIGNLTVILIGFGIAALVVYSTSTELFASNSPTKVFNRAVDLIRANEEISTILQPPLSFHGEASNSRMRRNRRVSSKIQSDPVSGDIMSLHFYVEGRPEGELQETWTQSINRWFRTLVYEPTNGPKLPSQSPPPLSEPPIQQASSNWFISWLLELFAGIFPATVWRSQNSASRKRAAAPIRPVKPELGQFSTGEVHARLRKDADGKFVIKALWIDIPESGPGAYRVHVVSKSRQPSQQHRVGMDRLRFWSR